MPFARMRSESLLRELTAQPIVDWPKHLQLARKILIDEFTVHDDPARAVLLASFSAAHACAHAINQRARDAFDTAGCLKLRNIFSRVARCVRRSSASLRRILDSSVRSSVHHTIIDSESIEALVESVVAAFASFPKEASSLTVLRAITPRSSLPKGAKFESPARLRPYFAEASALLKEDYSALRAIDQRKVETALTALRDSRDTELDAADVCEAIANALDDHEEISTAVHDLITEYVAVLAEIWLKHGVKPGRAVHPSNPNYRGKFHRFAEFVLTAVVEPWSKRHDGDHREALAELCKAHAQLPKEDRKFVGRALRRSDVEWLVSDDHVKKALAQVKKRPSKLHNQPALIQR